MSYDPYFADPYGTVDPDHYGTRAHVLGEDDALDFALGPFIDEGDLELDGVWAWPS